MVLADGRVIPRITYLNGAFRATVRVEHSEGMGTQLRRLREGRPEAGHT
jgi:hypothetical protein